MIYDYLQTLDMFYKQQRYWNNSGLNPNIFLLFQSTEVYGLVSKDLEDVSTQATSMVRSSSMTLKKTLEVRILH